MGDQNITALPKKTSSQMAATDYLLGIDSAEGYQMLIQDLGDYIIQHATSSLAGANQTLAAAINGLNSKIVFEPTALSSTGKTIMQYLDSLPSGCFVQAHTWARISDMPAALTDGLMSVLFITDKVNRAYDYVIVNKNGNQWLAYSTDNTLGERTLNWVQQPTREEVNALKNVLSPTLSGCGSGSSIHAVQIGTVVVVTAKIEYSGTNVTISGLPAHNGDIQNGFAIIARDQNNGSVVRMWTNGSSSILKVDNLTEDHLYGLSYTYIIA